MASFITELSEVFIKTLIVSLTSPLTVVPKSSQSALVGLLPTKIKLPSSFGKEIFLSKDSYN